MRNPKKLVAGPYLEKIARIILHGPARVSHGLRFLVIVAVLTIPHVVDFILGVGIGEWAVLSSSAAAALFPVITNIT